LTQLGVSKNPPQPPQTQQKAPDFSALAQSVPTAADDGTPIKPERADYKALEAVQPPDFKMSPVPTSTSFGWQKVDGVPYYCQGSVCGEWSGSSWFWMQNQNDHWYMQTYSASAAGGSVGSDSPVLRWHQQHWWWQADDGLWYVAHDGDSWAYRYISRWKQAGLVDSKTGAEMFYTTNGDVTVFTPGKGGTVYDATSGKVVQKVPDDQAGKPAPPLPPAVPFLPAPKV
jgi:hypothetical protein